MVLMQKVLLLSTYTENVKHIFLWQGHFHSFRTHIFELIILAGLIFASL